MTLLRLDITHFRNLESVQLSPYPTGFNLFYGQNGSGKTSLLEAIYYLSIARSFRSTSTNRIINYEKDRFSIFAQILSISDKSIPLGMERRHAGDLKIRIDGEDIDSIAELINLVPVQLINSHCHHLIDSSPIFRRKYLDWGVFYGSNQFLSVWRDYHRALKQRNAALKGLISRNEIMTWTKQLIEHAEKLNELRQRYVEQLFPLLFSTLNQLISLPPIHLEYQSGWDKSMTFEQALVESYPKDTQYGYTQCGPHRADIKIVVNGVPAKDILSRGQQKMFACGMILAQGMALQNSSGRKPIYLIDDLPAELDMTSKTRLMTLLTAQQTQVFVTAIEREMIDKQDTQLSMKMFHVEHGCVREV